MSTHKKALGRGIGASDPVAPRGRQGRRHRLRLHWPGKHPDRSDRAQPVPAAQDVQRGFDRGAGPQRSRARNRPTARRHQDRGQPLPTHRRRAALPGRAEGRPGHRPGRHQGEHPRQRRTRDRPHREHPARGPQPHRRGRCLPPAPRGVRAHAGRDLETGREGTIHRRQFSPASPTARQREETPGVRPAFHGACPRHPGRRLRQEAGAARRTGGEAKPQRPADGGVGGGELAEERGPREGEGRLHPRRRGEADKDFT